MKTCKKTTRHDVWEIWNEWTAESVYFLGRPTKEQIWELVTKEWAESVQWTPGTLDDYIQKNIHVSKLTCVFETKSELPKPKKENSNTCLYCGGLGRIHDDSYSVSDCHWCNGTGKQK